MVRGSGAVMLPASAVLPCMMMSVMVLRCVLRGWIVLWVAGALLSRGNCRQEKCCRNYQKKTLHWNLPF
jgi:hypothetical protein